MEVDANEIEARWSLAQLALSRARAPEALTLLNDALAALTAPSSCDQVDRSKVAHGLFSLARRLVQAGEPLALMAAWAEGKINGEPVVRMSEVDLHRVLGVWDQLIDFATSPDVLGLRLGPASRENDRSTLETLLLHGGANAAARALERPRPLTAGPRVGRNDPCTCGSGRKFKRCCGA